MEEAEFECPCGSGKPYEECCRPYHRGRDPQTALDLMRSRFSAYAMNNIEYIVRTTHPRNPALKNLDAWKKEILNFAMNTDFERLEILGSKEDKDKATVAFIAYLKQGDEDATFTERSFFAREGARWYYVNGDLFQGEHPEIKA